MTVTSYIFYSHTAHNQTHLRRPKSFATFKPPPKCFSLFSKDLFGN